MTEINKQSEKEGFKVYELAIHLLPTLSEADSLVEFSKIKAQIEKLNGSFISEQAPNMFKLAYEIPKTIKAQKKWYETSYFGWVKFDLEASKISDFEKFVKQAESTLRYIIVKTIRENTLVSRDILAKEEVEEEVDVKVKTETVADIAEVVETTDAVEVV